MGPRLIVSDNREDPGNPLILDGQAIDEAARDPVAIGKLMVDQVWAEGADPTGGGLYYERNTNQHRRLQAFQTGSEDFRPAAGCGCWPPPSRCARNVLAWSVLPRRDW
jgi:hypothetical protein